MGAHLQGGKVDGRQGENIRTQIKADQKGFITLPGLRSAEDRKTQRQALSRRGAKAAKENNITGRELVGRMVDFLTAQ
jgi:hypothetical protein